MKIGRRFWLVGGTVLLLCIGFIVAAYHFDWIGTGFENKTLWDWLQLLIIPLALAIIALLFNLASTRTEQKIAAQRYEQDQKIALDKQRDDLLQIYLDRMSELLLEKQLRLSKPNDEVSNVARVRTIAVLFQLDARRARYMFTFLREAGLMASKPDMTSIVSLHQADLSNIDLSQVSLIGADLSEANLVGANLSGADLSYADLTKANLDRANLSHARFEYAGLSKANLNEANLKGAKLSISDFSGASLKNANLSYATASFRFRTRKEGTKANFTGANLSGANCRNANFSCADLSGADLDRTNIQGVKGLEKNEIEAYKLRGAII